MRRKMMTKLALAGLVAVTAVATPAAAECEKKVALRTTGLLADASGNVDVRAAGERQRFKVEAEGRVADGTTLVLYINGLAAGTMTFLLNTAEVEFNNANGGVMPNGAESACSVSTVELRNADNAPVFLGNL